MTKLAELMRMGAAKRTMTLETMGMSKGKTLARLDDVPVELPKVISQETKKMKYGTVVKLVRVIRSSYVDSKPCMERLHEANLGRALLESLRAMSKDKDDQAMESLLTCIGDLFEWDFFAKSDRRLFLEDIFEIIHARYTSPGLLLTEALSVIMTMFTTDNDGVLRELRASRKCLPLFFEIISNMPKTKSFHFQALVVEIVYRILRMLRKSTIKKDQELIQKILESLPPVLSQGLQSVTPKEFRAGTRQLLNQFNQEVGVVQTFPIKGLSFEHKLNKSILMDEAQWFDMGGMNFEVEVAIRIADELAQGVAKLHCSNVDGYSTHGKSDIKLYIKNCVALADILPNVNDSEWSDIHGLVVALQVDPSVFGEIVASLKLQFKLIEMQDGTKTTAIEAQSTKSRAAAEATSKSFYELLARSKPTQPVEVPPVRPQISGKPPRRVTKKPDVSEGSREVKAEQIHEPNLEFKPATSNKTNNSSRKRPPAKNELVQGPQPSTKLPPGKVKRERQVEPMWEFEQSASRPTNPHKKQKTNETKTNPFTKPRPSTTPAPSRSRATLPKTTINTSLGAGQQWKQEAISHHDTMQHESHRLGLGTRNSVEKEDAIKNFESMKGPRAVPSLSTNSRRTPGPSDRALRTKGDENEQQVNKQSSTKTTASFLNLHLKPKMQMKAPNEGCDRDDGLFSANHSKSFDRNGLHAVMDTFEDIASTTKRQHMEYNRVPVSPSDSNASADMEMQSISSSQPSSKASTPSKTVSNHHVISASPHQKKLPLHDQRNDASKVPAIRSPLETQQDLLGKFTDLTDAILEQQERYRHCQLQHVVEHNMEKFEKSIGEFSSTLRSRLGFSAIGLALEDALAQHRDQAHAVKHHLDETLSSMHDDEAVDDNLLSDCSALKQLVMQNGRTLMQDRMKLLAKKVDSCRTKRKHQMQSKLKEIKDKFNSNDLLAMQALLGRI